MRAGDAHPDEYRNGVISGAVERYLHDAAFWEENPPLGSHIGHPDDRKRPTLAEQVKRREEIIGEFAKVIR